MKAWALFDGQPDAIPDRATHLPRYANQSLSPGEHPDEMQVPRNSLSSNGDVIR